MSKLNLEIITPQGEIFNSAVKSVLLPGSEGEFGVYENHASLISLLQAGVIKIDNIDGSNELVAINSGHAKVNENSVVVLAQGAVYVGGSDSNAISKKKLEEAKELLIAAGANSSTLAYTLGKVDAR